MTPRATATEIPDLVRRLGSRQQVVVDAARARLAIIGARSVEALNEALEGDNNRIRGNTMPLLALINDPRGREPLMAMLLDRDARMREIAARCLGRFPSGQTVAALERLLKKDKVRDVRVAAVHALVEQYAAGQERAVRKVLEILFDSEEDSRLRVAALTFLPQLRASERRGIVRRLKQDPSEEVVRKTVEYEGTADRAAAQKVATLQALVQELASEDYPVWNEAVYRLAALGSATVAPLVAEMRQRADDPEYCARAGMVLKALGPRRVGGLGQALDEVEEPLPLQVLVEVAGALGEKSLIYRLKDLIDRIRERKARLAETDGFDPMQRVRAKAHLELARIGSRVAIQDLRDGLADRERRLELEMLAAVKAIGKKDEIADLLLTYLREDRFMRERIADVVRAIMKRERIRRNSRIFQALGSRQRSALEKILAPRRRPRKVASRRRPKR